MNATRSEQSEKSAPNLWISGLLGWVIAFAGVLILFGIARLLDVPLQVPASPGGTTLAPMTVPPMFFSTIVPALVATALYALLRRIFQKRASRLFQVIAVVILLLSLGAPLSLAVSTANKIFLALMHVTAAAAITWSLTLRK